MYLEHAAGPRYREWLAAGGVRVSPDPLEACLADNECIHGALPHDGRKPADCFCWTNLSAPDLMGVLKRAEEAAMDMDNNDILNLARERDGVLKRSDVIDHFACEPTAASKALSDLVDEGKLLAEGVNGGRKYLLTEAVGAAVAAATATIAAPTPKDEPHELAPAIERIERIIEVRKADIEAAQREIDRLLTARTILYEIA